MKTKAIDPAYIIEQLVKIEGPMNQSEIVRRVRQEMEIGRNKVLKILDDLQDSNVLEEKKAGRYKMYSIPEIPFD